MWFVKLIFRIILDVSSKVVPKYLVPHAGDTKAECGCGFALIDRTDHRVCFGDIADRKNVGLFAFRQHVSVVELV